MSSGLAPISVSLARIVPLPGEVVAPCPGLAARQSTQLRLQ
jgi:hypothetical protein